MPKVATCIYIDYDLRERAKAMGLNISRLVEQSIRDGLFGDNEVSEIKRKVSRLEEEKEAKKKRIDQLNREIEEIERKIAVFNEQLKIRDELTSLEEKAIKTLRAKIRHPNYPTMLKTWASRCGMDESELDKKVRGD